MSAPHHEHALLRIRASRIASEGSRRGGLFVNAQRKRNLVPPSSSSQGILEEKEKELLKSQSYQIRGSGQARNRVMTVCSVVGEA